MSCLCVLDSLCDVCKEFKTLLFNYEIVYIILCYNYLQRDILDIIIKTSLCACAHDRTCIYGNELFQTYQFIARCKDVQVGRASGRQRGGGHRAAQECGRTASGAHLQRPGENHRGEGERKRESGLATPASMQCTQNISMSLD